MRLALCMEVCSVSGFFISTQSMSVLCGTGSRATSGAGQLLVSVMPHANIKARLNLDISLKSQPIKMHVQFAEYCIDIDNL